MEVLYSVKIFDIEFSPGLYVLMSHELKKMVLENWPVLMCRCVCVTVWTIFKAFCISETNKDESTKFHT